MRPLNEYAAGDARPLCVPPSPPCVRGASAHACSSSMCSYVAGSPQPLRASTRPAALVQPSNVIIALVATPLSVTIWPPCVAHSSSHRARATAGLVYSARPSAPGRTLLGAASEIAILRLQGDGSRAREPELQGAMDGGQERWGSGGEGPPVVRCVCACVCVCVCVCARVCVCMCVCVCCGGGGGVIESHWGQSNVAMGIPGPAGLLHVQLHFDRESEKT
eukprot:13171-Chlamydomonas_euryale.AAC.3